MNIQDLYVNQSGVQKKNTMFSSQGSFLSLGKKGDQISGIISKVSEQVTMRFGKTEVNLPKESLSDPQVGQKRDFEIEDISKNHIVLKELHKNSSASIRGQVNTTVSNMNYSFEQCLENNKKGLDTNQQAGENVKLVTGNDYEQLEDGEGSVQKQTQEGFDQAVARIKEKNAWNLKCQEENIAFRKELQEGLEKCQKTGSMDHKTKEQLKQMLASFNLPVSDEIVQKIMSAVQMSQSACDIEDDSKVALLSANKPLTIENIYQSQYSGDIAKSSEQVSEQLWQQVKPQVDMMLQENNLSSQEEEAKWLFANEIPVTAENIEKLSVLDSIKNGSNPEDVLNQILTTMSRGLDAKQTSLDRNSFIITSDQVSVWGKIDTQTIAKVVTISDKNVVPVTLQLLRQVMNANAPMDEQMSRQNQNGAFSQNQFANESAWKETVSTNEITVRRQVAEIQLKMTMQSAGMMREKGIDIETTSLEKLVEELRNEENEFYKQFEKVAGGGSIDDSQLQLFQNTMEANREIEMAPASGLAMCVKQQALLTWGEFHGKVVLDREAMSFSAMGKYTQTFEAVGTQVRADLGDSIKKAFGSVPDLLKEIGLEDTQANERAVRILGYNQMEVTKESVSEIKFFDQKVNRLLDQMKPSVVLKMIQDGKNPLDMTLDSLQDTISEIQQEQGVSTDEKYSKYLWQLEKDNQITAEERKGYIGIYRLLHQIESTDGAAIGAVVHSNRDMTLETLLTAVRTMKGNGVDASVNDEFGALDSLRFPGETITEQIQKAFYQKEETKEQNPKSDDRQETAEGISAANTNVEKTVTDSLPEQEYYNGLIKDSIDRMTPSKVLEMSDGDLENILSMSVEQFAEKLKTTSGRTDLEKAYYEEQAKEVRTVSESGSSAVEYLKIMEIPDTMENIQAVEWQDEGYQIWSDAEKRKKILGTSEQKQYDDAVSTLSSGDGLENEDSMNALYEKVEQEMQNILKKSYEQTDISYDDLKELKKFSSSLQLTHLLSRRRSYDIPVRTEEGITEMNVTIVQGMGEKGKVAISLKDLPEYGNIEMEWQADGNAVKGLLLCDQRQGYEKLADQKEIMEELLSKNGFEVKSLSVAMDYKSRVSMADMQEKNDTDTVNLYRLAKSMVKYFSHLSEEK